MSGSSDYDNRRVLEMLPTIIERIEKLEEKQKTVIDSINGVLESYHFRLKILEANQSIDVRFEIREPE